MVSYVPISSMRLQAKSGEEMKNSFIFACVSQSKKKQKKTPNKTNRCNLFFHSPLYRLLERKYSALQGSPLKDRFSSRHFWHGSACRSNEVCFAYGSLCIDAGNCSYWAVRHSSLWKKINKYLIHKCKRGDEQNIQLIKINGFRTHGEVL